MNNKKFSRLELYKLVWSEPISKIIEEYAITNNAFKELCIKNDVPLPLKGHWSKIKYGKTVDPIPLSESSIYNTDITLPKRISGEPVLNKFTELDLLIRDIKSDNILPQIITTKLNKPDKLVTTAKEYFTRIKKAKKYTRIDPPKEGVLSINVSNTLEKRALIFTDALIKLLKKRGHSLVVHANQQYSNHNGTKIIVFGEIYYIRIRESNIRIMEQHPKYDWKEAKYFPSGKLTLKLDNFHKYTWSDSKNKLLEHKLPDILAYLELRAKREIKERKERETWHKEYERKQKIEEELKLRRFKELETFKSVINHSSRWQKSMDLRNYIKAVEFNAIENNKMTLELKQWLNWINQKADWYDPLIEKEDELFKNINRDTLN